MARNGIADMEDLSCPYCGRFYFLPDEELMGMLYAPRQAQPVTLSIHPDTPRGSTAKKESA